MRFYKKKKTVSEPLPPPVDLPVPSAIQRSCVTRITDCYNRHLNEGRGCAAKESGLAFQPLHIDSRLLTKEKAANGGCT